MIPIINSLLLAALWILLFVNPALVLYIWIKRGESAGVEGEGEKFRWRSAALWAAQVLVTAAVILFWYYSLRANAYSYPEDDKFLMRWSRPSQSLALAGLICAAIGKGTAKKVTVACSAVVFLNWISVYVFA